MNPDGQTDEVGQQDQPAVASGRVGFFFPAQHQPECYGREEGREGIDFTFPRGEPEGITERIDQRTGKSASHDQKDLFGPQVFSVSVTGNQLPGEMSDGPEQKQDAAGTQQGIHDINKKSNLCRISGQLGNDITGQHEERSTGWMTDFQFGCRKDEFRTIPEAGRRFYCQRIDDGGQDKRYPSAHTVDGSIGSHNQSVWFMRQSYSGLKRHSSKGCGHLMSPLSFSTY